MIVGRTTLLLVGSSPPSDGQLGRATPTPTTETDRTTVWRSFITSMHQPSERALQRGVMLHLRRSRDRYIDRAGRVLSPRKSVHRSISDTEWVEILSSLYEDRSLARATRSAVRRANARAFRWAARQVGVSLRWDPVAGGVDNQIARLVSDVNSTTKTAIRNIIETAILGGETVSDIQERIRSSTAFSLARSLTIARTETTRAVSGGSYAAYQSAGSHGVTVRQQWLSARSGVRPSHQALDGQPVRLGEKFIIPAGHKNSGSTSLYPGGFRIAEEDINCRCTVIPLVD